MQVGDYAAASVKYNSVSVKYILERTSIQIQVWYTRVDSN